MSLDNWGHFNPNLYLDCHPNHLSLLFWQLLENACHAIAHLPNEKIYVTTGESAEHYEIYIQDRAGYPADWDRAFELGYSEKQGHAGIGLSFCQQLMSAYNGTIQVHHALHSHTQIVLTFPKESGEIKLDSNKS